MPNAELTSRRRFFCGFQDMDSPIRITAGHRNVIVQSSKSDDRYVVMLTNGNSETAEIAVEIVGGIPGGGDVGKGDSNAARKPATSGQRDSCDSFHSRKMTRFWRDPLALRNPRRDYQKRS